MWTLMTLKECISTMLELIESLNVCNRKKIAE